MGTNLVQVVKKSAMSKGQRAFYFFIILFGFTLASIFGFWWLKEGHIPTNFSGRAHILDLALYSTLTFVVWYHIIQELFFWFVGFFMKHPQPIQPSPGMKVAFLTAFVPGSEPLEMLEKTLKAMVSADYPHDTWLLDEGDDQEAKRLCALYGVRHFSRKGIEKYNTPDGHFKAKTKAGNYNSWYKEHGEKYEYVAQIDVDFIPNKDFLTKTLGYFQDPKVGFVGSPQVYGNTEDSWIAKGAAEQAYGFFGTIQKGLYSHDMPLFIGANHVVRVKAHNTIKGYSGHIVEDHLTGMKFYANGWKSVYVPEVLAVGEGPSTWDAYFSQQMRWAYGLFHILFTQSPKLFLKMKPLHIFHYFILQQYYVYGLAQALAILLLALYLIFGVEATSMKLGNLLIFYLPLMVVQQIIFIYLQKFNIDPKKEKGFMIRAKLLNFAVWPIYFVALLGVLTGKRLTYKVTPKGDRQGEDEVKLSLFIPHFILGSITFAGLIASFYTKHQAIQLIFFAWLNTTILYYFVLNEAVKKLMNFIESLELSNAPFVSLGKIRAGNS
jgi:cellulose synthase (UDP-forming)